MAKLKSERHHWWPECVSQHWADADGGVNWLLPSGEVRRSKPENFGLITNGHHIKLSHTAGEVSPWDVSFENEFERADSDFPQVIKWLNSLERNADGQAKDLKSRLCVGEAPDKEFSKLVECIISLAVRSPMHREDAVRAAEYYRGPIANVERNGLIGLNIRHSHRKAVASLGCRGKAMIVYSPRREFIFGDGFFHNISAPVERLHNTKIFAPITPSVAVLYAYPMAYCEEPRLVTLVAMPEEVDRLNYAIHVYARTTLFYRSEKPEMTDAYQSGRHLRFSNEENDVERLIYCIPGVLRRRRGILGLKF